MQHIQQFNPNRIGEINELGDLEAKLRRQEYCKSRYTDHLNGIQFSKIKMAEIKQEITTFLEENHTNY